LEGTVVQTFKEELLAWAANLPKDCDLADVEQFVYVRRQVEAGLADVEAGRVVSHNEAERESAEWLKSYGPAAR
jgi:hypothetical protein